MLRYIFIKEIIRFQVQKELVLNVSSQVKKLKYCLMHSTLERKRNQQPATARHGIVLST